MLGSVYQTLYFNLFATWHGKGLSNLTFLTELKLTYHWVLENNPIDVLLEVYHMF